jgi:hypothetical protein
MTRTSSAARRQSKSSSQPPPAKHARNAPYFSQKCFREWTLDDYLDDTGAASADKLPNALRCWTQSLRTIAKCRDKACCPLRNVTHARLLLSAYKQVGFRMFYLESSLPRRQRRCRGPAPDGSSECCRLQRVPWPHRLLQDRHLMDG